MLNSLRLTEDDIPEAKLATSPLKCKASEIPSCLLVVMWLIRVSEKQNCETIQYMTEFFGLPSNQLFICLQSESCHGKNFSPGSMA